MKKILVTGANGQLGKCFRQLEAPGYQFVFAGSADLDVSNARNVKAFFDAHQPDWCVNCAAYTAVDKAETEPEQARKVNRNGPANLARECARLNIPLLHFSTDYVYHNGQNTPFVETDKVSPKGVYARTKQAGEQAAMKAHPTGTMVIRTSWVYAPFGNNFVRTMLRLGAERPALNVVFDQIGTPTYAPDLAAAMLEIIQKSDKSPEFKAKTPGIWHYSNEGVTSWYDFATAIMQMARLDCKVSPIESSQYPTPAQRPHFSVLNKGKIKAAFQLAIPHWTESLGRCLEVIAATPNNAQ